MSSTRYYLNPDGSLREVEEPGRCEFYFVEYQRVLDLVAREPNELNQVDELRQAIKDKMYSLHCHLEECTQCRAWLDHCERLSLIQPHPGETRQRQLLQALTAIQPPARVYPPAAQIIGPL